MWCNSAVAPLVPACSSAVPRRKRKKEALRSTVLTVSSRHHQPESARVCSRHSGEIRYVVFFERGDNCIQTTKYAERDLAAYDSKPGEDHESAGQLGLNLLAKPWWHRLQWHEFRELTLQSSPPLLRFLKDLGSRSIRTGTVGQVNLFHSYLFDLSWERGAHSGACFRGLTWVGVAGCPG